MAAQEAAAAAAAAGVGKRGGPEKEVELPARKKGKKGGARGKDPQEAVEVRPEDLVRVVPHRRPQEEPGPTVLLSRADRAPQLRLADDRLSVTGWKGFRSARATHGAHEGTWYCEVTVSHLGATGHARLGWATRKAELSAPVGYDAHGFGYRDVDGSRVHRATREPYGEPFAEGDVVGLLLHLPPGGRRLEPEAAEVVRHKGALYSVAEDREPAAVAGSFVGFSRNGVWQGVAFRDLPEGAYYPTVSLFTLPQQQEGATAAVNFGPQFTHPPPAQLLELLAAGAVPAPVSELPARYAEAAAAQMALLTAPAGGAGGSSEQTAAAAKPAAAG